MRKNTDQSPHNLFFFQVGRERTGRLFPLDLLALKSKVDNLCQYSGEWGEHLDSLSIDEIIQAIRCCDEICQLIRPILMDNKQSDMAQVSNNDFLRYCYLGFELIAAVFRKISAQHPEIVSEEPFSSEEEMPSEEELQSEAWLRVKRQFQADVHPLVQLIREDNRLLLDFITDYIRIEASTQWQLVDPHFSIDGIAQNMKRIAAKCELNTALPEENFQRVYEEVYCQISEAMAEHLSIWELICYGQYDEAWEKVNEILTKDEKRMDQDIDFAFCYYMMAIRSVEKRDIALKGLVYLSCLGSAKASYQLGLISEEGLDYVDGSSISRNEQAAGCYFKQAFFQGDCFFTVFSSLASLMARSCPLVSNIQETILKVLAFHLGDCIEMRFFCQQHLLLFIDNMAEAIAKDNETVSQDYTVEELHQELQQKLEMAAQSPFAGGVNGPLLNELLGTLCPSILDCLLELKNQEPRSYQSLYQIAYGILIKSYFYDPPPVVSSEELPQCQR